MKLAEKSSTVSELVPQGYKSWTEYYQKESMKDTFVPALALLVLLGAYLVIGTLEVMV